MCQVLWILLAKFNYWANFEPCRRNHLLATISWTNMTIDDWAIFTLYCVVLNILERLRHNRCQGKTVKMN